MNTSTQPPNEASRSGDRGMFSSLLRPKGDKPFFWILKIFAVWRLSLVFLVWLASRLVPVHPGFLGGGLHYADAPWLWAWANFDGVHYLSIAQNGYFQYEQAFFPFFPVLIRHLAGFTGGYLAAGLWVANVAFVLALWVLYRLICLDHPEKTARRTIFLLLLFPTSYYFGAVYTESLFLLFTGLAFYWARKKRWLLTGLVGALAGMTRLAGIFLVPALAIPLLSKTKSDYKKMVTALLPVLLIGLGLVYYMGYLQKTTGDPLSFFHSQPFFGAQRSGDKLILPYQVLWRYLKMIFNVEFWTTTYFVVILELGVTFLFTGLTVLAFLKNRTEYAVFMLLGLLTPSLTGTLSSVPRYVVTLFPGFVLLAQLSETYPRAGRVYGVVSALLLVLSLLLFSRGYWVA